MRKIALIFAALTLVCQAQFDSSLFTSNNQKLIEQAVQNGFVIVEQSYQLEDTVTHKRYGRLGGEVFGKARALGVKVNNDIVFDKAVLTPWEKDANFERYRNSHLPVNATATLINPADTVSTPINLVEGDKLTETKSLTCAAIPDALMQGFSIEEFDNTTDGWIVWISSETSMDEWYGAPTQLTIHKKKIDFTPEASEYAVEAPQHVNNMWGGVFIVPQQTQIGQLTFKLAGVMVPASDGNWVLETFTGNQAKAAENPDEPIEHSGDELTPLN